MEKYEMDLQAASLMLLRLELIKVDSIFIYAFFFFFPAAK